MKTLIICALALISTSAIADTLQDDARHDLEQAKTAPVQTKQHMSGLDYLKAGDNASDGKAAINFYLNWTFNKNITVEVGLVTTDLIEFQPK